MSGMRPGQGESLSPPARAELTGPDDEKNIARFASRSETGRGERGHLHVL